MDELNRHGSPTGSLDGLVEEDRETLRVLVVEDDPSTAAAIGNAVRRFGYDVECVSDGLEAWNRLQREPFPIVLTDWMTPGEDGLGLCRRIRGAFFSHYIYVVFVTSKQDRAHLLEALASGADDFITKPFDPEELRVRLRVGERIVALERSLRRANKELRHANAQLLKRSRIDPLMEIGNRLAFEEKAAELHAWATNSNRDYGVVMCDVDHFKCYNDTFGHQKGDQILRRIAAAVKLGIRAGDFAFRYGGEELVLLLVEQDLLSSVRVAERVRRQVEAVEFELEDAEMPFRVTISCGVASYPENRGPDPDDWRRVVEAADRALYMAKDGGRNQVATVLGPCCQNPSCCGEEAGPAGRRSAPTSATVS